MGKSENSGFLAHLSQGLIGELIVYPWSGVRLRPSVVRPSVRRPQCSNIFFSETDWSIKVKFYVESPWVGGNKILSAASGSHDQDGRHAHIWGKTLQKIFFSRTGWLIFPKLAMLHRGLQPIIVCSNDNPGVTVTYFTARSNLVT